MPLVINPFDEYALEGALQQKDALNATLTALCIGDDSARDALKHTLAMGADHAILVHDPALAGLDSQSAAVLLAAAVKKIGDVKMVFFGRQTLDHGTGLTSAQTARALGWPLLSLAGAIQVTENRITIERSLDESRQIVSAMLPAVVSVVQTIGEPRYPSFAGIRRATRADIPVWSLADLDLATPTAIVRRLEVFAPASGVPCEFVSGNTHEEIAETLADKILMEKVL
jgi:electron transfer flavoprotein beta subunit